ncbi:MAG: hypothetical protein M0037_14780 [Betaproteobacteria bacterium]|nr:hypothetical protein [Betaproteobacteria bacterium]
MTACRHGADAVTLLMLRRLLSVPVLITAAVWQHRRAPQPMRGRDWLTVSGLGIPGYGLGLGMALASTVMPAFLPSVGAAPAPRRSSAEGGRARHCFWRHHA